jgi:hypothetical protein
MAKKMRLEFEGAKSHVSRRGSYRKDIFESRAAEAFEKTLFEGHYEKHLLWCDEGD